MQNSLKSICIVGGGSAGWMAATLLSSTLRGSNIKITVVESPDIETISNVLYIAPHFSYKWSERWHTQLGLTYAQLSSDSLSTGVDKDVGFEVDVTLKYRPYEGVQWINRVGVFAPGGAFKGGVANNFGTETVFGIETKAAITF